MKKMTYFELCLYALFYKIFSMLYRLIYFFKLTNIIHNYYINSISIEKSNILKNVFKP